MRIRQRLTPQKTGTKGGRRKLWRVLKRFSACLTKGCYQRSQSACPATPVPSHHVFHTFELNCPSGQVNFSGPRAFLLCGRDNSSIHPLGLQREQNNGGRVLHLARHTPARHVAGARLLRNRRRTPPRCHQAAGGSWGREAQPSAGQRKEPGGGRRTEGTAAGAETGSRAALRELGAGRPFRPARPDTEWGTLPQVGGPPQSGGLVGGRPRPRGPRAPLA
nr:uncharacterized protein LOC106028905 [Cavia porcellus]